MGQERFKAHFEKLYTFEDLIDDFFKPKSFRLKETIFGISEYSKEKVIKNENNHQYTNHIRAGRCSEPLFRFAAVFLQRSCL